MMLALLCYELHSPDMFTGMEVGILGFPALLISALTAVRCLVLMRRPKTAPDFLIAAWTTVFLSLCAMVWIMVHTRGTPGHPPGGF
jgi:hypothetical protein